YGAIDARGEYVGSLDSMEIHRLFQSDTAVVFAPPDRLLFARQGALVSQPIDLKTFSLTGQPTPVAERIALAAGSVGAVPLSASLAGPIAFRADAGQRQLVWLNRSGQQTGALGDSSPDQPLNIRLSPDAQTVALTRTVNGNADIWLADTARAVFRRLTSDAGR